LRKRGRKELVALRIIAGDARGRRLFSPDDRDIRPTSDKVKGAIFNMLGAYIRDAVVADLFAGSGSLGVEALSRGARYCYFCDRSAKARALIEKNIAHCGCGMADRSEILHCDYRAAIGLFRGGVDIVFLDPPYDNDCYVSCLAEMAAANCLTEAGIVVAEHSAALLFPDTVPGFAKIKEKKYGAAGVTVFEYEAIKTAEGG
jgi:16S rRNA (guanine(966)-N(2))-methyltransferase RsmD